jgi:DnaJ like chaperone protein
MSIWARIADALAALAAGEPLSVVFDRLKGGQAERSVGFTIAVIALAAKLAKADGQVTRDEVATFRRVFTIDDAEADNAARVYNLARQDVAGFDAYARKVRAMFGADDRRMLIDVLEGLFHIALSDGRYHPNEDLFLAEVAHQFGLDEGCFQAVRARFVDGAARDPFLVLGLAPDADLQAARAAWRQAVKDNHPDAMIARGVPAEAVRLAERRLIEINTAWQAIQTRVAA